MLVIWTPPLALLGLDISPDTSPSPPWKEVRGHFCFQIIQIPSVSSRPLQRQAQGRGLRTSFSESHPEPGSDSCPPHLPQTRRSSLIWEQGSFAVTHQLALPLTHSFALVSLFETMSTDHSSHGSIGKGIKGNYWGKCQLIFLKSPAPKIPRSALRASTWTKQSFLLMVGE